MQVNKYFLLTFILLGLFISVIKKADAQNTVLLKQLEQSHYLRTVMKADTAQAGLTRWLKKKVTQSRVLPLSSDFYSLKNNGPGTIKIEHTIKKSDEGSILLETPASLPVKNPTNRSYASAEMIRPLKGESLTGFNRFSVWVYADAPGFYSVFVGCTLYNAGKHVMPTPGRFEGQHFETIYPNKWHRIIWEIPDLYRDSVTGFSVNIMLTGSPKGASDQLKLYIDDMRIEQVDAENSRGFNLRKDAIAYSHSGYKPGSLKQALVQHIVNPTFRLLNEKNQVVFTGKGKKLDRYFVQLDFSKFNTPGFYTLKIDGRITKPFAIGEDAWLATALLKDAAMISRVYTSHATRM